MRLFVALWPGQSALDELEDAVAPLRARAPALRWTTPEQWHLTLAFLGEVDDGRRADLEQRLGRAAHRHPALTLHLRGGGRFGDRVLFTRVGGGTEADSEGLRRLAGSVSAAARRARIPVDERQFRAHLTLARSAGRASPGEPLSRLAAALQGFSGSSWRADAVHLVCSRLGQGPGLQAAYETVASWPLARNR